jgi:hypothetical protein
MGFAHTFGLGMRGIQNGANLNLVKIPDWFTHPMLPNLSIKRIGGIATIQGKTTEDFRRVNVTPSIKYVNGSTGLDTNNGDTELTPYLTFTKAQQANPDRIVLLTSGLYCCANVSTLYNRKTSYEVICTAEEKATLFTGRNGNYYTWTAQGGDVYRCPLTVNDNVFDYTQQVNNSPLQLSKKTTLADCQGENNSYFNDGTYLYIHLSRQPDINIAVVRYNISASSPLTDIYLYFENVSLLGGITASATTTKIIVTLKNSKLVDNNNANLVTLLGNVWYWSETTPIMGAFQDCLNLHGSGEYSPAAVVLFSSLLYAGVGVSEGNNNASSCHENSRMLGIGCTYGYSDGPVVHDIGTALSFYIDCDALESTSIVSETKSAWAVSNGGTAVVKMALDGCSGGSITTFGAENRSEANASKIYVRNCNITNIEEGTELISY